MVTHFGCTIPEDLYYHLDFDSWVRFEGEDEAVLGMTDPAQTQSGKMMYIQFKKEGRKIRMGRSAATIESAKWVGPFRIPFDAEVLAVNMPAFQKDLLIANKDPYGEGWLVRVRLLNPEKARKNLITGEEAIAALKQKIEAHEIRCYRCLDDPIPMK